MQYKAFNCWLPAFNLWILLACVSCKNEMGSASGNKEALRAAEIIAEANQITIYDIDPDRESITDGGKEKAAKYTLSENELKVFKEVNYSNEKVLVKLAFYAEVKGTNQVVTPIYVGIGSAPAIRIPGISGELIGTKAMNSIIYNTCLREFVPKRKRQ